MSTLARGDQIERDFYELKSQEFGPLATKQEIEQEITLALSQLRIKKNLQHVGWR